MPGAWKRGLVAAAAGVLAVLALACIPSLHSRVDAFTFDLQARGVRELRTLLTIAPANDVVVVGIDEETLRKLGVPMAMLHEALGTALKEVVSAHPRAIGLDLSLPERSFDAFAPGLDRSLMQGLRAARQAGALAIALDIDEQGRPLAPYLPLLAVAGGETAFGLPVFPVDCDGGVRRYEPDPAHMVLGKTCGDAVASPGARPATTFAGRVAGQAGIAHALDRAGWLDFTRVQPFDYVPLHALLASARDPRARVAARFEHRIVLFGSVLPFVDRIAVPVRIVAWEPASTSVPGVVLNALVLQNALGSGLLRDPPPILRAGVVLLALGIAFVIDPRRRGSLFFLALLVLVGSGFAAQATGWFFSTTQASAALLCAFAARAALDFAHLRRERDRIERVLGPYVSPQVRAFLLRPRAQGEPERRPIALLFADLQGFTEWSEHADPQIVSAAMNRYYQAIIPVLHAHGGTVDNFRGDGVMVMFGAPEPSGAPCSSALRAARDLQDAVAELNAREAGGHGMDALRVGVGMDYGEVAFGEIGSSERKDFTALGDAVNVAARLQEFAKQTRSALCVSARFVAQLEPRERGILEHLGPCEIKGHSPVDVYAWKPTFAASQLRRASPL